MLFFRIFQHLLPTGEAWRTTTTKTLRKFFEGLASSFEDVRDHGDAIWEDIFPDTTRELEAFERQFGLAPNPATTEAARRLALDAKWKSRGGQSVAYIESVLHAAGFTGVYVHEWWASGPPYVARDPRSYTNIPTTGTVQCAPAESAPQCGPMAELSPFYAAAPQCNDFLGNRPNYIVNKNLTPKAPSAVPSDPTKWPYFIYVGGPVFGDIAVIPSDRRTELERLLLSICPAQHWIVFLIEYDGVFDETFDDSFL